MTRSDLMRKWMRLVAYSWVCCLIKSVRFLQLMLLGLF